VVDPALFEWACRQPGVTLCVRRNGQIARPRRFVVVNGVGLEHKLGVQNNSADAVLRALIERSVLCEYETGFSVPIRPVEGFYYSSNMQSFAHIVIRFVGPCRRRSFGAVVAMYSGAKQRAYQRAREELESTGFVAEHALLRAFTKFEKQDITKAPRIINPRSVPYNLMLATFLKRAEKLIYKAINEAYGAHTGATVIKGLDARASARVLLSKWQRFKHPVGVGLDAKKFDLHVSVQALRYEHSVYLGLFPGQSDNSILRMLLLLQLRNQGVAYTPDGRVKFAMDGTRCSGDINTSCGNCILMCSLVHALSVALNITVELANNGDDCMVFMEEADEPKFVAAASAFFRQGGFVLTVEPTVRIFERVEFCQTHPVCTAKGWIMVRNHDAVLKKDAMCLLPVTNQKALRKWMGAVGECGLSLTQGVPVQEHMYRAFIRCGLKPSAALVERLNANTSYNERKFVSKDVPITAGARCSYEQAFGISPNWQVIIENFFDTMTLDNLQHTAIDREALLFSPGMSFNAETTNIKSQYEGGQNGPSTPCPEGAGSNARDHGQSHPSAGITGRWSPRNSRGHADSGSDDRPQPRGIPEQVAGRRGLLSLLKLPGAKGIAEHSHGPQDRTEHHYPAQGTGFDGGRPKCFYSACGFAVEPWL